MEAFFLRLFTGFSRLTALIFLLSLAACQPEKQRHVQRSFYYWKTVFQLTGKEQEALRHLSATHVYLRLFDIGWNESTQSPAPVAPVRFTEKPGTGIIITPVVFITYETLQKSSASQLHTLGIQLVQFLSALCTQHNIRLSGEVQIDCDWTAATKEKYFGLLQSIRQQPFIKDKKLSATIRLHQLKYTSLNGIPPVDKGLLMAYNMGNLQSPQTKNSIIELSELKKYTGNLKNYPLPLDVALPIFDWHVWFKGNRYHGLLHTFPKDTKQGNQSFTSDTVINDIAFSRNDWLRHEDSNAEEVRDAATHLAGLITSDSINVILYHLDQNNLTKYKDYELENMFNSFR